MTATVPPSVTDRRQPDSGAANPDSYIEWKEWEADRFGQYTKLDAAYFAAEVGLHRSPPARVLELGFGNGSFLAWARDVGADAYGVELNPVLVGRAVQMLGAGHGYHDLDAPELTALRGSFTHLVAFDVLEHIEQSSYPHLFGRFAEMLAPGGKCVLRFPNGDSPFGRRIQHADPTHVTVIGSAKLMYFAQRAGFRIVALRNPALPTAGVGLRRGLKRRVVLGMRFAVESFFGSIYSGRRIAFDENSTAVLIRA
jgi:2-polyprenyl-3-methyl-5-hydroxy-6-metoxy-1,4-benzoquinol methylase